MRHIYVFTGKKQPLPTMIRFKRIYVGDSELPTEHFEPRMIPTWREVLLDETSTKSVMIFRKNRYGDISMETIMRDNGHIRSHVNDDTVNEKRMWKTVYMAYQNGCDVYLTLDPKRFNRIVHYW